MTVLIYIQVSFQTDRRKEKNGDDNKQVKY